MTGHHRVPQDRTEACVARLAGGDQVLDAFDGDQGVLVDRVLVVEVADHAGLDTAEFREEELQDAKFVEFR